MTSRIVSLPNKWPREAKQGQATLLTWWPHAVFHRLLVTRLLVPPTIRVPSTLGWQRTHKEHTEEHTLQLPNMNVENGPKGRLRSFMNKGFSTFRVMCSSECRNPRGVARWRRLSVWRPDWDSTKGPSRRSGPFRAIYRSNKNSISPPHNSNTTSQASGITTIHHIPRSTNSDSKKPGQGEF